MLTRPSRRSYMFDLDNAQRAQSELEKDLSAITSVLPALEDARSIMTWTQAFAYQYHEPYRVGDVIMMLQPARMHQIAAV